jgi:hypothetical protein
MTATKFHAAAVAAARTAPDAASARAAAAASAPQARAEYSRATRHRMRAIWDQVERMLTDPDAPRRDASGRDVFEVWADLVLQNPPLEFARVAREIVPPEPAQNDANAGGMVTNIQSLYLTAVQAANRDPDPRVVAQVEGTVTDITQKPLGYNQGTGDVIDW